MLLSSKPHFTSTASLSEISRVDKRRDWTNTEEQILRAWYSVGGTRECMNRLPKRTINAIRTHAHALGLRAPPYRQSPGKRKYDSTDAMDNVIRLGFENQKPGFLLNIARQIGRGEGWIKQRAAELGIVILPLRNKDWSQEEDRLLADGAEDGMNSSKLSGLLKRHGFVRSLPAVRSRLFRIQVALHQDCETTGTYNIAHLAALFGADWRTVKKWINILGLPAERQPGNDEWLVDRQELRRWVMKNLAVVNFHTLDKYWFASLLYGERTN